MIDKQLHQLIEDTIQSAQLDDEASQDLQLELESHMEAAYRDLLLQGFNSQQSVQKIITEFGKPEHIGQSLLYVHRRFEHWPLIGSLLYYPPVRQSSKMIFFTVSMVILIFIIFYYNIGNRWLGPSIILLLGVSAIVLGIWLYSFSWQRLQTAILHYIPFIIILIGGFVNELSQEILFTSSPSREIFDTFLLFLYTIVICIHAALLGVGFLLTKLIYTIKHRYARSK